MTKKGYCWSFSFTRPHPYIWQSLVAPVSDEIELIFLLVSVMVLCFWFSIRILRRHWCGCSAVPIPNEGLLRVLCAACEQRHKKPWGSEGTWVGQMTQTGQNYIPHHKKSCPVYKLGGPVQMGQITTGKWAGHQLAGGEILFCITSFSWALFLSLIFTTSSIK